MSRRRDSASPPLFFLHIPKTAGTSLRHWLGNHFAAARVCWIDHHDPHGGVAGPLDAYDLVGGHACYGFADRFARQPRVITFLRDPIERALSAFYFFRQLGKDRLRAEGTEPGVLRACDLDLADFIARQPDEAQVHLGSTQVRMLCRGGIWLGRVNDGPVALTPADLEAARANLARCEFIGLTEHMEASIALLCGAFGWPSGELVERANRTEGRASRDDLDARTFRLLEDLTAPDRALYRFAAELFEQRLQQARRGPGWLGRLFQTLRSNVGGPRPESASLSFDQPIPGHGWLGREVSGRCHYCWLEREAWIELRVTVRGDMRLRCTAFAVVAGRQLGQVSLAVNGVRLPTTFRNTAAGLVFEADAPYRALRRSRKGLVRVGVSVAEPLRPCDVVNGTTDSRRLGLAVHRIELLPAREERAWAA